MASGLQVIGLVYERDHDIYAALFEVTNKYRTKQQRGSSSKIH